jgi:hypothetical protein
MPCIVNCVLITITFVADVQVGYLDTFVITQELEKVRKL